MEQTYNRVDLANEQLDDAISLFLKGRFASALMLASAAEEILGKSLSHSGRKISSIYNTRPWNPFLQCDMKRKRTSSEMQTAH